MRTISIRHIGVLITQLDSIAISLLCRHKESGCADGYMRRGLALDMDVGSDCSIMLHAISGRSERPWPGSMASRSCEMATKARELRHRRLGHAGSANLYE